MAAKHLLKLPAKHKFKDIKGPIPYHILPSLNNTYDIGSAAQHWRDLWLSRYLRCYEVASHLIPAVDNIYSLGTVAKRWAVVYGVDVYFDLLEGITLMSTNIFAVNKLRVPYLLADPIPLTEGLLWLRTDLDRLKYSPDGVSAKLIPLVLDDIQDVEAPSPSDGHVLTYEAATSLWKNKAAPAGVINSWVAKGTTDISTTSTSWVDVSEMTITQTFKASKLLIIFVMSVSNNQAPDIGIEVDGSVVRQVRGEGYGVTHLTQGLTVATLETVAAGSHTIKGKWKLKIDGTLTNNISTYEHSRTLIVVELPT